MANYRNYDEFAKAFKKNAKKIEEELAKSIPEAGQIIKDDIKKRTRLGFGVPANESSKQKLARLSASYVRARQRLRANGQLSTEATPAKSNLTLSGSMLDSLKVRKTGKFSLRIEPTGTDANGVPNIQKAGWVTEQGRPFLFISKPELKRVVDYLKKELDSILKRLF